MSLLRFAWLAADGFRAPIARIALMGFIVALLEAASLVALFSFVSGIATIHLNSPTASGRILGSILEDVPLVGRGTLVLALATVRFLLSLLLEWQLTRLWVSMRSNMQKVMLAAHLNATITYLLEHKVGEHIFHIIDGPSFAAVFYLHLMRYLSMSLMLMVLFFTLFAISPALMAIAVIVAVVYSQAVRRISNRVSMVSGAEQADAIKRQLQLASEGLAGVRHLKMYSAVESWTSNFSVHANRAEIAMRRAGFWNTVPARSLDYLVLVVFMALALYALSLGQNPASSLPTFAVYFLGIVRMLPSLSILGNGRMQMMQALPNLERFIDLRSKIPRETLAGRNMSMPDLRQAPITFSGVSFAYGTKRVFENLSLTIESRQLTVILGPSGEGKSTMLDLIMRFVEPVEGKITAGGRDIHEFDLSAWRGRIAYLGQEPFIFHGTVMENICLGRPGATAEAVWHAAHLANATEFIEKLPDGWSTVLADRGQSLSGGQRQRIALARALLSGADILLLDEPTSALDSENARIVAQSVAALRGQRTIVVVTHSNAFLPAADFAYMLAGGRLAPAVRLS